MNQHPSEPAHLTWLCFSENVSSSVKSGWRNDLRSLCKRSCPLIAGPAHSTSPLCHLHPCQAFAPDPYPHLFTGLPVSSKTPLLTPNPRVVLFFLPCFAFSRERAPPALKALGSNSLAGILLFRTGRRVPTAYEVYGRPLKCVNLCRISAGSVFSSSSFSERVITLQTLARFLGFLLFAPVSTGHSTLPTDPQSPLYTWSGELPLSLVDALQSAVEIGSLVLTLPWVLEVLGMMRACPPAKKSPTFLRAIATVERLRRLPALLPSSPSFGVSWSPFIISRSFENPYKRAVEHAACRVARESIQRSYLLSRSICTWQLHLDWPLSPVCMMVYWSALLQLGVPMSHLLVVNSWGTKRLCRCKNVELCA
jgi:hypothetical protein